MVARVLKKNLKCSHFHRIIKEELDNHDFQGQHSRLKWDSCLQGTPVKTLPYNHRLLKVRPRDPYPVLVYIKSSLLAAVRSYRKEVWALSKTRNIIPYELHLFEQKKRIRHIENTLAISNLLDMNNITFIR